MRKLYVILFVTLFAVVLTSCNANQNVHTIPPEYQEYFDEPEGEAVELTYDQLAAKLAATKNPLETPNGKVVKSSGGGLYEIIVAQTIGEYTNIEYNFFLDYDYDLYVQLAEFADELLINGNVKHFELHQSQPTSYGQPNQTLDVEFSLAFYATGGFAYYAASYLQDVAGTPIEVNLKEKIDAPIPHTPLTSEASYPIDLLPELDPIDLNDEFLEAMVDVIKAYETENSLTIDVTFNLVFLREFFSNMLDMQIEHMTENDLSMEGFPTKAEFLAAFDASIHDFNFLSRLKWVNNELVLSAQYVDLDIDLDFSAVESYIPNNPYQQFKIKITDAFESFEIINAFPGVPDDLNTYAVVDSPSFAEYFSNIFPVE